MKEDKPYVIPDHIKKGTILYFDTIYNKYIDEDGIEDYCIKYWKRIGFDPSTGKERVKPIKVLKNPKKTRIDWDLYDSIKIKKQVYQEKK